MKTIYIGGSSYSARRGGIKWKLYMSLFIFFCLTVSILKLAAPTLVEKWINEKGADSSGYAFSIRDTKLSLTKGQVVLNDVKVFNPETNTEIIEAPEVTVQLNWADLITSQEKSLSVSAEQMDLILSKDFTSEMERIKGMKKQNNDLYLDSFVGKIDKLNIIEKKEDQSRTVVELTDVNVKAKEFSLATVNKKSEFSISSKVADGGKLNLTGKTVESNGSTPWTIFGTLKNFSADILNKIAGEKLPFGFREEKLNAEISAKSEQGKVVGEILPDVKILNLIDERPGIPTQTIKRALTDELTFSLPFTLNDGMTFQYQDTFTKLKNYRKPGNFSEAPVAQTTQAAPVPKTNEAKKSSFWPF